MRRDRLRSFYIVGINAVPSEFDVFGTFGRLIRAAKEVVREAQLEVVSRLNLVNLFRRQLNGEGLDVGLEM